MAYPFVHAYYDLGIAKGPRLAKIWHMAEGGGTVSYLSKYSDRLARDKVSVHFVIDYEGDITQMLALDHMHSSIRTSAIRLSDDTNYPYYGRSAAKSVMGRWADIANSLGPNHASIAIEVQGFAANGPNLAQTQAIDELDAYINSKVGPIPNLGHRDFADYKPCPGYHFPWSTVGGHAIPTAPESNTDMAGLHIKLDMTLPDGANGNPNPWNNLVKAKVAKAGSLRRVADDARVAATVGMDLGICQTGWFLQTDPATAILALNNGNELYIIQRTLCTEEPITAPTLDCTAPVKAATDPLNDQVTSLTTQLAQANATITAKETALTSGAADLRAIATKLDAA